MHVPDVLLLQHKSKENLRQTPLPLSNVCLLCSKTEAKKRMKARKKNKKTNYHYLYSNNKIHHNKNIPNNKAQ